MRHVTIALLLQSAIHSCGLHALLRHLPDVGLTLKDINPSDCIEDIGRLRPSIIIVDPSSVNCDLSFLKGASSFPVKLIALLSHQVPKSSLDLYDDTISIYDSPEIIVETISKCLVKEKQENKAKDLSPREKEVVIGVVKGLSNKEIASMMHVSVNTVMTHRRNIASKLHIHTSAGLTIYAIVSELISLDEIKADMSRTPL